LALGEGGAKDKFFMKVLNLLAFSGYLLKIRNTTQP
jgi:hypothetical protein